MCVRPSYVTRIGGGLLRKAQRAIERYQEDTTQDHGEDESIQARQEDEANYHSWTEQERQYALRDPVPRKRKQRQRQRTTYIHEYKQTYTDEVRPDADLIRTVLGR